MAHNHSYISVCVAQCGELAAILVRTAHTFAQIAARERPVIIEHVILRIVLAIPLYGVIGVRRHGLQHVIILRQRHMLEHQGADAEPPRHVVHETQRGVARPAIAALPCVIAGIEHHQTQHGTLAILIQDRHCERAGLACGHWLIRQTG